MYSVYVNYRNGTLERFPSEYSEEVQAKSFAQTILREDKEINSVKVVSDENEIIISFRREKRKEKRKISTRTEALYAMDKFIAEINDYSISRNWWEDGITDMLDIPKFAYGNEFIKIKKLFFELVEGYAYQHPNMHITAMLPNGLREIQ